jgi:DNA-binding response OmpR family regulator
MANEVSREQQLEDRVVLLSQQLEAIVGSDEELGVLMSLRHGITQKQAWVLHVLVKKAPAYVSLKTLHTLMYGDRDDGGPEPKIFNVHVSRLRAALRRLNCPGKIDTVWRAGFRADENMVKWVQALYDKNITKEK